MARATAGFVQAGGGPFTQRLRRLRLGLDICPYEMRRAACRGRGLAAVCDFGTGKGYSRYSSPYLRFMTTGSISE